MDEKQEPRSASLKLLPKGGKVPHNAVTLRRHEVTRESIAELIRAWRPRYKRASRKEKGRILDELEHLTGYHRKSLIRALSRRSTGKGRRGRPRTYTNEVRAALVEVWELSGRLCSKRLVPFMEEFLGVLERCGELKLRPGVKGLLLRMSPATMDRILRAVRPERGRKGPAPRSARQLKGKVPVRVGWGAGVRPGYVELDLVAHCGTSTKGEYLHTLNVVDIATSWCEPVVIRNRALEEVKGKLPFPLLGIDSDNDSAFLNGHLLGWCKEGGVEFTRCRPYRKNDQAHIEQKNWVAVRQLIGYDRYEGEREAELMEEVYRDWRLLVNFFQPVRKLVGKERAGGRVRKIYDEARTPYRRVLGHPEVPEEEKVRLRELYLSLNPVRIKRRMEANLRELWQLRK
jgi:hypothetical protein